MGARLVRFNFTPKENEQIETVITVPDEPRSVIHGIVKDCKGRVVKDAVVKLFEVKNPCNPCILKPLTHIFTDDCGQFIFGPLCPGRNYVIKVWYNDVKIRELIIKHHEECDVCDNREEDEMDYDTDSEEE